MEEMAQVPMRPAAAASALKNMEPPVAPCLAVSIKSGSVEAMSARVLRESGGSERRGGREVGTAKDEKTGGKSKENHIARSSEEKARVEVEAGRLGAEKKHGALAQVAHNQGAARP